MSNVEKVNKFLDNAKTFYFLTTDGDRPKGRPFSFHMLEGDKLYFGCGTFKKVYSQISASVFLYIWGFGLDFYISASS